MTCTYCGGWLSYLGRLGDLFHWRCACCGMNNTLHRDDLERSE